jgi:hypothetical protein
VGGAEDGRGLPGRSLRAQQPCGIVMEGRGSGGNGIGRVENTLTLASSPNTTLQPPRASPRPRHGHSREHACASVGFLGLEGSCRRPRDRRGASRSQRQPAATLDARCEHQRQRGQLNPTQEPSAQRGDGWLKHAGHAQTAGLLGGILPPMVVDEGIGARRHPAPVPRHGAEVLLPPGGGQWRASDHSQRGAGKRSQPSTHGLARGSGGFAAAGGLLATDKRRLDDSGSRLTRPPTPASTAAAVSRVRCWSRQQQPGDGPAKVSDVPSSRDY